MPFTYQVELYGSVPEEAVDVNTSAIPTSIVVYFDVNNTDGSAFTVTFVSALAETPAPSVITSFTKIVPWELNV